MGPSLSVLDIIIQIIFGLSVNKDNKEKMGLMKLVVKFIKHLLESGKH